MLAVCLAVGSGENGSSLEGLQEEQQIALVIKYKLDQVDWSSIKSQIDQLATVKCEELHNALVVSRANITELNKRIGNLISQKNSDEELLKNLTKYINLRRAENEKLDGQINDLTNQLKEFEKEMKLFRANSCIPFGNSTGVHQIIAQGIDRFEVLCDSQTAGPGWTVIQQRLDGKENFARDWATYRQGFGSLSGDFFLGLERIHLLTTEQRHELYIHMEMFNGTIQYAHYDNFSISSVDDQYELIDLGNLSGNVTYNSFEMHTKMKFTTYDNDNDVLGNANCASLMHGGWWYTSCGHVNLNGKFFNKEAKDDASMHWLDGYSIRSVKMLIRPKTD
ncbi:hypothetical protein ACLKA6_011149 [Drosophila palustris]